MTDRNQVQLDNLHLEELLELLPEHLKEELLNTVNCCLVASADKRSKLKSSFVGATAAASRSPRPTTSRGGTPQMAPPPTNTKKLSRERTHCWVRNRRTSVSLILFRFSVMARSWFESQPVAAPAMIVAILRYSPQPRVSGPHPPQEVGITSPGRLCSANDRLKGNNLIFHVSVVVQLIRQDHNAVRQGKSLTDYTIALSYEPHHSEKMQGKLVTFQSKLRKSVTGASRSAAGPRAASRPSGPRAPGPVTRDDLVECQVCSRRFATDRIQQHEEICARTGQKKRKVFDPVKARVKGTEAEAYIRKIKSSQPKKDTKKADWRRKHEDFIATIRAAKQAQAHIAAGGKVSDLPPPPPSDYSDYVQCPHCNRRFNTAAADRHIPRCATMLHNKPKSVSKGAVPKRR
ncbi:unnamed protein product [Timema podura]|uniref:C2HC/C3H-type domain-containing protein n=1 Tax=Timema podura TaxID=61482 RepID=A0ABN7NLC5_TIMPD|nr:unnamed protein product [Timema podura]